MHGQLFTLEAEVFQVLANEKRIEILQLLRTGERNVSEMIAMLGLRQANLSQHLSLLRKVGLLTSSKKGREIYYSLSDRRILSAVDDIRGFLSDNHKLGTPAGPAFPFVVDPVCGMRFSAADAYDSLEIDGKRSYFCATGCRETFLIIHRGST